MRKRRRSRKKSSSKFLFIFIMICLLAGAGYVYTAPEFERMVPQIESKENIFWNKTDPLSVRVSDNVGLKDYELILSDGKVNMSIAKGSFTSETKVEDLAVIYPKESVLNPKVSRLKLTILVSDKSMWNFFRGNKSTHTISLEVDHQKPNVNIVSNSYSMTQGGSGLVIFQASDANLDELYIVVGETKFKVEPYKATDYYVALIAWPFTEKSFNAKIIAKDKAGNKRVREIPFYLKNKNYRVSWIKAKDQFIDGKITDLAGSNPKYAGIDNKLERLRAVNERMRLQNEDKIHHLAKNVSKEQVSEWKIKKFYPLKNAKKVASYGDERHYYYENKDNEVSQSYHVGYDLASTKMANIVTSNSGKVVYASDNGIYGNMPMIDHGLGLYSLYGHCSQLLVKEGDTVAAGDKIARTGTSGLALGDHLHFGILVQGIEVRPIEWFDEGWIQKNIDNVFADANKIILGK